MNPEWNSIGRVLLEFFGLSVENQKERLRVYLHVEVSQFAQYASPVSGLAGEITVGEYKVQRKLTTATYRNTAVVKLTIQPFKDAGSLRISSMRCVFNGQRLHHW